MWAAVLPLAKQPLMYLRSSQFLSKGKRRMVSTTATERVLLLIPVGVTCNSGGKWQIEKIITFPTPVQIYCSVALRSLISICLSCQWVRPLVRRCCQEVRLKTMSKHKLCSLKAKLASWLTGFRRCGQLLFGGKESERNCLWADMRLSDMLA